VMLGEMRVFRQASLQLVNVSAVRCQLSNHHMLVICNVNVGEL
jgi:hypothetical protein